MGALPLVFAVMLRKLVSGFQNAVVERSLALINGGQLRVHSTVMDYGKLPACEAGFDVFALH